MFRSSAQAKSVTNIYTEGFEGKGMPKGWDYYGYWYWSSGGYGDYNGSAVFNFWENYYYEGDGSLTTPTFDLSAYSEKSDELFVEFDMWFEYEYYNNFGDDYIDFYGHDNVNGNTSYITTYSTSSDNTYYNPKDEGYQYDPISEKGYWRHIKISVPYELRTESMYFWFQSATKAAGGNFAIDNFSINVEQDLMISSTPSFLEFGKTSVGIATAPQTITITNESAAYLNISSIGKNGPNPNDFQFVGALPTYVEPYGTATISVLFLPTLNGEKYATVNISNNSENLPLITVQLHGKGSAPGIELIPIGTVNTPNRMYKKTRTLLGDTLKQSFLVKNIGEGVLIVSPSSFINGDNPGMYAITRWPSALAEGMTDTMTVRFIPTIEGSDPARLNVENNGYNGRQIVDLFGVGILPHIEVSPAEMITFDSVAMGVTVCKQVTITNPGSDILYITNDYLSSSDGDFSYTGLPRVNGVATILPGQSAIVNVCITPLQNGTRRARLRFTTNIPMTFPMNGPRQDTSVKSVEIWANAVPSDR
ncbi:MAG TPA: choice-of-anchor D domain-containing protein, partial [Candidatus Kapabacteria bacterium]